MKLTTMIAALAVGSAAVIAAHASAGPAQDAVIKHFEDLAKKADPGFSGFSAERGKALFIAKHANGKPETPSCTSCHTSSPQQAGRTRAGKAIEPMALSKSPDRYSDLAKVEKWFRRNCDTVMGRECTPQEKGDFLVFMTGQ